MIEKQTITHESAYLGKNLISRLKTVVDVLFQVWPLMSRISYPLGGSVAVKKFAFGANACIKATKQSIVNSDWMLFLHILPMNKVKIKI